MKRHVSFEDGEQLKRRRRTGTEAGAEAGADAGADAGAEAGAQEGAQEGAQAAVQEGVDAGAEVKQFDDVAPRLSASPASLGHRLVESFQLEKELQQSLLAAAPGLLEHFPDDAQTLAVQADVSTTALLEGLALETQGPARHLVAVTRDGTLVSLGRVRREGLEVGPQVLRDAPASAATIYVASCTTAPAIRIFGRHFQQLRVEEEEANLVLHAHDLGPAPRRFGKFGLVAACGSGPVSCVYSSSTGETVHTVEAQPAEPADPAQPAWRDGFAMGHRCHDFVRLDTTVYYIWSGRSYPLQDVRQLETHPDIGPEAREVIATISPISAVENGHSHLGEARMVGLLGSVLAIVANDEIHLVVPKPRPFHQVLGLTRQMRTVQRILAVASWLDILWFVYEDSQRAQHLAQLVLTEKPLRLEMQPLPYNVCELIVI